MSVIRCSQESPTSALKVSSVMLLYHTVRRFFRTKYDKDTIFTQEENETLKKLKEFIDHTGKWYKEDVP